MVEAEGTHNIFAELVEKCLSVTTREELMAVCDGAELAADRLVGCLVVYANDLADKLRVEQDPAASKMLELRLDESKQWHGAFKMLLKRLAQSKRRMSWLS